MLKVLEVAASQVGYLEKASNKDLDDFTKNAGKANYTKYARDLDAIPNFYNGRKQAAAWCDVFVDWCMVQAYGAETAKVLLCQPDKSLGAGCKYSAQYYQKKGQFFANAPQAGDQIFFITNGNVSHTGLVEKVEGAKVYTIEGNTSGSNGVIPNGGGVCRKSYNQTNAKIFGYGRPNYDLVKDIPEEDIEPIEPDEPEHGTIDLSFIVLDDLQKGSEGALVETVQALLIFKYGISCGSYGMDGDFGSATEKAVKKFQKLNGFADNGVVNYETWTKLLKG